LKLAELMKILEQDIGGSVNESSFWEIGKSYFMRTVTMSLVGELKEINADEILLKNCSWIADTGRFHDALRDGSFDEIEPFMNDVIVNRRSLIDCTRWMHALPSVQK
jgi:hypothetical protein